MVLWHHDPHFFEGLSQCCKYNVRNFPYLKQNNEGIQLEDKVDSHHTQETTKHAEERWRLSTHLMDCICSKIICQLMVEQRGHCD